MLQWTKGSCSIGGFGALPKALSESRLLCPVVLRHWAKQLLLRWGIVSRDVLKAEVAAGARVHLRSRHSPEVVVPRLDAALRGLASPLDRP